MSTSRIRAERGAAAAEGALASYASRVASRGKGTDAQLLTDLLTDLRHYAAQAELPFYDCLATALSQYLAEVEAGPLPPLAGNGAFG